MEQQGIASSPDQFLDKLKQALRREGDFPASAKVVSELRALVSDPKVTANKITEVILREPSLSIRVLSLVNSAFYQRAKPIMTVSQAVVQIGIRPLAEMCAGLVLLQKFVPAARQNAPFANCLKKSILTSLLSSTITPQITTNRSQAQKSEETGFLVGSFRELGTLLLAFYFPQVYENALKRSELKRISIGVAIQQLVGLSPTRISIEIMKALGLPEFYIDVLEESEKKVNDSNDEVLPIYREEIRRLAQGVHASESISTVITSSKNKLELDSVIQDLAEDLKLDISSFGGVLGNLPALYRDHCQSLQVSLPPLPTFIATYTTNDLTNTADDKEISTEEKYGSFLDEIKQAVENKEPAASIITTVMETLAWGMKFDRVFLLLLAQGRKRFVGRMLLGKVDGFDPTSFAISLTEQSAMTEAFNESKPIFSAEPIFKNANPVIVIPIGFGKRSVGIIYADRNCGSKELTEQERDLISVISRLLDRSLGGTVH